MDTIVTEPIPTELVGNSSIVPIIASAPVVELKIDSPARLPQTKRAVAQTLFGLI